MKIINALFDTFTQTNEWNQIQESPIIKQAESELSDALEKLDEQVQEEIMSAAYMYATACERAALLFGIGLVDTIRAAGADPTAYLQNFGEE